MAYRKSSMATKSPTREERAAVIRRYLKPDQNIEWAREMITFAALWKAYPSLDFWTHHELPFMLNHMSWFQGVEGVAQLESDWLVFHYEIPKETETHVLCAPDPLPPYSPPPTKPRTIAEFLRA